MSNPSRMTFETLPFSVVILNAGPLTELPSRAALSFDVIVMFVLFTTTDSSYGVLPLSKTSTVSPLSA